MNTHTFPVPLVRQRADPWIYRHTDGLYYFTASVPEFDRIELRVSETLEGLSGAKVHVIWTRHEAGEMSANIWAPEIHFIDGKWYIYFAAARESPRRDERYDHRIYVLENGAANPLNGGWMEKGQIETGMDTFSLDATTFALGKTRYLVWAQKEPAIPGNSNLYIARMKNPWTLATKAVRLSVPEYEWEKQGFLVNEGPAAIVHGGRVFLSYSASATDSRYCMGLLRASCGSDLLSPAAWMKAKAPVMKSCADRGIYGPGHNCFTVDNMGETILVYHARMYEKIEGDPLFDPNRHTMAKYLHWDAQDMPIFV